jgi:hypothetical protein
MRNFAIEVPSPEDLLRAHQVFAAKELRGTDEYYRAVTAVDQGFRDDNVPAIAKAISTLLKSWNWAHLRFKPKKVLQLESDVQELIVANRPALNGLRDRSIISATAADQAAVLHLFHEFEKQLGQVGAAKALHLIAPSFPPLWDNQIALCYGVGLSAKGYAVFMLISKIQVEALLTSLPDGLAPLKAIDEFNYAKYTKGWYPVQPRPAQRN